MADPAIHPNAAVAQNLNDAASARPLKPYDVRNGNGLKGTISGTEAQGGPEHTVDPTDAVIGFNSTGWVGIVALVVLLGMLWRKVPAMVGRTLDGRIAEIRSQLDEATRLRTEAEALRNEYAQRARTAEAEAATMRDHAHHEAQAIVAKAKKDAEDLMDRRARMAEDKIAASERAAIAEVRARAADAAARAAATLIAEHHDAAADRAMVGRTIAGLGRLN